MKNHKNKITGAANALAHLPCCVAPHIAAHSLTAVSRFMHSAGGVVFGGIAPPVVTWVVNEVGYHFNKKHKCDTDCNHTAKKKNNSPTSLKWWRENKKSLLIGYGMQVLGFGIDAMTHDHGQHKDDDHNTISIEQPIDQTPTNKKIHIAQYIA